MTNRLGLSGTEGVSMTLGLHAKTRNVSGKTGQVGHPRRKKRCLCQYHEAAELTTLQKALDFHCCN